MYGYPMQGYGFRSGPPTSYQMPSGPVGPPQYQGYVQTNPQGGVMNGSTLRIHRNGGVSVSVRILTRLEHLLARMLTNRYALRVLKHAGETQGSADWNQLRRYERTAEWMLE